MHVYFSGVGGVGIGPLALIAKQLGFRVSGSDINDSSYINNLKQAGIDIHIGQTWEHIEAVHRKHPIDWFVYSSAITLHNPQHPEFNFAQKNNIKTSKRDEFLSYWLSKNEIKLLSIAGTHGKTTTTAMAVWLMRSSRQKFGYSIGGKIPFGPSGSMPAGSQWFIYEADEFDRNFLAFKSEISLISGLSYDHQEIYPTMEDYNQAFRDFIAQSKKCFIWSEDARQLYRGQNPANIIVLDDYSKEIDLLGEVNRRDAQMAIAGVLEATQTSESELIDQINQFPGLSRRFEKLRPGLYSDYAHTPEKIAGCLDTAQEFNKPIVVLYEPLTNRRQHYIKDQYADLFNAVKKLYWLPSYLAREDKKLALLSPSDLIKELKNKQIAEPAKMNQNLLASINQHLNSGEIVVAISGGGAKSLDSWLRQNLDQIESKT